MGTPDNERTSKEVTIASLSVIDALRVNLAIRNLEGATAAMERSSTIIEERRVRQR